MLGLLDLLPFSYRSVPSKPYLLQHFELQLPSLLTQPLQTASVCEEEGRALGLLDLLPFFYRMVSLEPHTPLGTLRTTSRGAASGRDQGL